MYIWRLLFPLGAQNTLIIQSPLYAARAYQLAVTCTENTKHISIDYFIIVIHNVQHNIEKIRLHKAG
jgi:hypothetical protein